MLQRWQDLSADPLSRSYLDVKAALPSIDFDQLQPSARQLELCVEDAVVQSQPVAALGSSNDDPLLNVAARNVDAAMVMHDLEELLCTVY